MTIEELEALLEGYRTPNDVDGQVFLQGRLEGHADIACLLAKAMRCDAQKLSLTGLLRYARRLRTSDEDLDFVRAERGRLMKKLERIENLSKHAWEQVDKNPDEAKELFRMIYAESK